MQPVGLGGTMLSLFWAVTIYSSGETHIRSFISNQITNRTIQMKMVVIFIYRLTVNMSSGVWTAWPM